MTAMTVSLPPPSQDSRIYAVGDIHGRYDLLVEALRIINEDNYDPEHGDRIVFLGDYIDRGPDSKGVITRLVALTEDPLSGVICLRGNHEQMLIDALTTNEQSAVNMFIHNGGIETLRSYDNDFPRAHTEWMQRLPYYVADEYRVYVHAGLMPGVPLHEQTTETCMWIRDRFLRADPSDFPLHVVHGHTPVHKLKLPPAERPELLSHRTNLDTAAVHTGVLSIGVFARGSPGGPMYVLSTSPDPRFDP